MAQLLQAPAATDSTATWTDEDGISVGALDTADNAAGNTAAVTIQTGNAGLAGGGDSGDIVLTPGTAAGGNVGTFRIDGRVTTTDGVASGTERVIGGLANRTLADSTYITGTASETAFSTGTYSIPANTLKVGTQIRFRAWGRIQERAGGNTFAVRLRFGAAGVLATEVTGIPTFSVTAGDVFSLDGVISARTIGAGGTMVANTLHIIGNQDVQTVRSDLMTQNTIDTTVARVLTLTGDWSTGSATNKAELLGFSIWID